MFTLTLTEVPDARVAIIHGQEVNREAMEQVFSQQGTVLSIGQSPIITPAQPFEHFRMNYRELPSDKLHAIMAILMRKPRSDKGKKKQKGADTPQLPGT